MGYWREALIRHDSQLFDSKYPEMNGVRPHSIEVGRGVSSLYTRRDGEEVYYPDIRKINILNSRVITSRKRTTNLLDLTNLWKKIVFQRFDAKVGGDLYEELPQSVHDDTVLPTLTPAQIRAVESDSDEEFENEMGMRFRPRRRAYTYAK
jgi:hypothetical protein